MEFRGPQVDDFANVRALNRAFLRLARCGPQPPTAPVLPHGLARDFQRLSERGMDYLSRTPFLLFSLRERDGEYWQEVLNGSLTRDFLADPAAPQGAHANLATAALGFAWQLAKRNPFAARLVLGATLHWCESLAELTLYRLLAIAGTRSDLVVLRFADDRTFWRKLLRDGVSGEQRIRDAAHLSAFQSLVTGTDIAARTQLRAAARRFDRPAAEISGSRYRSR